MDLVTDFVAGFVEFFGLMGPGYNPVGLQMEPDTRSSWDRFFFPRTAHTESPFYNPDDKIGSVGHGSVAQFQVEQGGVWKGPEDLIEVLYFMVAMMVFRFTIENFVAEPLGLSLGISKEKRKPARSVPALEKIFSKLKTIVKDEAELKKLEKSTGLTAKAIKRWYQRKILEDTPTTIVKFKEGFWRLLFYIAAVAVGFWTLWDKDFMLDVPKCYENYPFQVVGREVITYYTFKLGFYCSLLISSIVFDVRRKDFIEGLIHHVTTILLMSLSYSSNFVRIGMLVMLLHDVSDVFLEAAKIVFYVKEDHIATDILFATFATVFGITRLYLFPFYLIRHTTYQLSGYFVSEEWYSGSILRWLLVVLVCLHMFWFYLILKMIVSSIKNGSTVSDIREEDEIDSDDEETKKDA